MIIYTLGQKRALTVLAPIIALTGGTGCAASSEAEPTNDRPAWVSDDCFGNAYHHRLYAKSQEYILDNLGAPDDERRFQLRDGITPFTQRLLRIYQLPEEGEREILQQGWSHGNCHLTIWSSESDGSMTSVDVLPAPGDIHF